MFERIAYDTNLGMYCFLACCCERFATQKPMQKKMDIQVRNLKSSIYCVFFFWLPVVCQMLQCHDWMAWCYPASPKKILKCSKKKWCTFGAVLVQFWCTFESAPKLHQNGALSKVHQKCTKSAPLFHGCFSRFMSTFLKDLVAFPSSQSIYENRSTHVAQADHSTSWESIHR